jgi:uncharacterized membrane protein
VTKRRKPRTETAPTRQVLSRTEISYSGPLPPSEQLAQYDAIVPGLADRVVKMAESNASHRQTMEASVVEGNVAAQARGQWFAFILALAVLSVGGWLVHEGKTEIGLWVILGDVITLAVVFIGGRLMAKQERAERRRELQGPAKR